jgi:hypothetical protein
MSGLKGQMKRKRMSSGSAPPPPQMGSTNMAPPEVKPKRSKYATDFPPELVYPLPQVGQEGLRKIKTRVTNVGNQEYFIRYDGSGGEKLYFQFPNSRNRYVNFSKLHLCFKLEQTQGFSDMMIDPVVGMHGLIRDTSFITGAGEVIERHEDYATRVARNVKFQNDGKLVTHEQCVLEGMAVDQLSPNQFAYAPGRMYNNGGYEDRQANPKLTQVGKLMPTYAGLKREFRLPFRGSDFCMQPDFLIPLVTFKGLRLEITLDKLKAFVYQKSNTGENDGETHGFRSIGDDCTLRISDIHLSIEYYEIPQEKDNRLMSALSSGKVIPIQWRSSRILKGVEVLQEQTETENTIPVNETLSSVTNIQLLYRDLRMINDPKTSNFYFVEPGVMGNVAHEDMNAGNTGFRSFRVEMNGETRPEHPITTKEEAYEYLRESCENEGKVLAMSAIQGNTLSHSLTNYLGEYGGGATTTEHGPGASLLASLTREEANNVQSGGAFSLAMSLRNYRSKPSVMNGVPMKNNCSLFTKFYHNQHASTNYDRWVFLDYDVILEVGANEKTIVLT